MKKSTNIMSLICPEPAILNEDRRFNNLGMICTNDGVYKDAPIFDNGKSLFVGNYSIKSNLSMEENVKKVIARPFSGSHKTNIDLLGLIRILQKTKKIGTPISQRKKR